MSHTKLLYREESTYDETLFPTPRPFQVTALESLREGARAGHRTQQVMSPTGSGKTILSLMLVMECMKRGKRAMFVCDRTTLINQTSEEADKYGLHSHGIIQAKHYRYDPDMPFQIASAQTLARRGWPENLDLIVIDESHTLYADVTRHITSDRCKARVVGLSATAFAPGMGKIYTNLINAATMHDLTQQGILVPMRVYSCKKIDMKDAETKGKNGEWTERAAEKSGLEVIGDVVQEWLRFGEDRKTIGFGATIAHCEEMCRQFNEAGIFSATFTSQTNDEERKAVLDEFRKPDSAIKVLFSVEALAKGFDQRDVGCIIDCRPLRKSLSAFIQMIGRGARSSPETGKTDYILLDFSGNIGRFIDDYTDIYYNGLDELDAGEKLDKEVRRESPEEKAPPKCPACGFSPCGKRCISCGHERVTQSTIIHVPGTMEEVVIGKTKLADTKKDLYEQVCTYTRKHGNPDTASKRAWHLYRDFTGGKAPDPQWRFDAMPQVQISKAVINRIRHRSIAFSHRTGK